MFKNLKVGSRLILGFLVVALLGAAVAGIGIVNMDQMNERAQNVYEQDLKGISYLKEANIDLVYIGRSVRSAMLASTEADRRKHLDGVDSLHSIVQMPAGVPVATVSIAGARNAGLLAARILGAGEGPWCEGLRAHMRNFQKDLRDVASAKGAALAKRVAEDY